MRSSRLLKGSGVLALSLSSRCGSGEENCLESSAMRRNAICARLTIGSTLTR
ncbi:hypothetical protein D9M71_822570 [compost metagenome]